MSNAPAEGELAASRKARRNLTYLLLFAIVMFFAALTSAYVVSKGSADYWVYFKVPKAFWYSAATIVVSSISVQLALVMARRNKPRAVAPWLVVTLLLGISFTFSQVSGWKQLMSKGYYLVSAMTGSTGGYGTDYTITRRGVTLQLVEGNFYLPEDAQHARPLNAEMADYKNTASSYFYVLTVAHWLHLAGGLIALVVMTVMSLKGLYTTEEHSGLWQGVLYWHFLGALWLYLLLFLTFVH